MNRFNPNEFKILPQPQKFRQGDVVRIADDLGTSMSHFRSGVEAVIVGSYADQYGGDDHQSYTVRFIDDDNTCSWYDESQLTFIRHGLHSAN